MQYVSLHLYVSAPPPPTPQNGSTQYSTNGIHSSANGTQSHLRDERMRAVPPRHLRLFVSSAVEPRGSSSVRSVRGQALCSTAERPAHGRATRQHTQAGSTPPACSQASSVHLPFGQPSLKPGPPLPACVRPSENKGSDRESPFIPIIFYRMSFNCVHAPTQNEFLPSLATHVLFSWTIKDC